MLRRNYWFRIMDKNWKILLQDELFQNFHWHAAYRLEPESVQYILADNGEPNTATALLVGHRVRLTRAHARERKDNLRKVYTILPLHGQRTDHYYIMLDWNNFLFIPANEIPREESAFQIGEKSALSKYLNNFGFPEKPYRENHVRRHLQTIKAFDAISQA